MTPLDPFLAKHGEALGTFLMVEVESETSDDRTRHYRHAVRNKLYWEGYQYLKLTLSDSGAINFEGVRKRADQNQGRTRGAYVMNQVRGDGRKWIGLLGTRSPNAKAAARNPRSENDILAAMRQQQLIQEARGEINADMIQLMIAYYSWISGTVFMHMDVVYDKKYGQTNYPRYQMEDRELSPAGFSCSGCGSNVPEDAAMVDEVGQMHCPQCDGEIGWADYSAGQSLSLPTESGELIPNNRLQAKLYTVDYIDAPAHANTVADLNYLCLTSEDYKSELLALYGEDNPLLRDDMPQDGGGYGIQSRSQRDTRFSFASTSRKNYLTHQRWWLPEKFYGMLPKEIRADSRAQYPGGMRLCLVNGRPLYCVEEDLVNHWTVFQPETGEGLWRAAICESMLAGQDMTNDLTNIGIQTLERSNTTTLVDPKLLDPDRLKSQRPNPFDIIAVKPDFGMRISDHLQSIQRSEFPVALEPFMQMVRGLQREDTGLIPSVWGGGARDSSGTWREAEMRKNQGLQQILPSWKFFTFGWQEAWTKMARLLAIHRDNPENEKLTAGSSEIEVEEWIPQTWAQRSERVERFLENPDLSQRLGLLDPAGLSQTKDYLGMSVYESPVENERNRILTTIRAMLQQEPVMTPDGMPMSSLEPQWEDDSQLWVTTIKDWANDPEGGLLAGKENPLGYQNVIALGRAHEERLMMQQAPPLGAPGEVPPEETGAAAPPGEPLAPQDDQGPLPIPVPPPPPMAHGGILLPEMVMQNAYVE